MASSKISELTDGTQFEPGDETIIVRNNAMTDTDYAVNATVSEGATGNNATGQRPYSLGTTSCSLSTAVCSSSNNFAKDYEYIFVSVVR